MIKESIVKIAEEIILFEYLEKFAAIDPKYWKEINTAFLKYISGKTFSSGSKKVPYLELSPKDKEKVFKDFWESVSEQYMSVGKAIEKTLETLQKQQPAIAQ